MLKLDILVAREVNEWVESYTLCREREKWLKMTNEGMGSLSDGQGPWMKVCFDIIGPMDCLNEGEHFVVVMVDAFSRWVMV